MKKWLMNLNQAYFYPHLQLLEMMPMAYYSFKQYFERSSSFIVSGHCFRMEYLFLSQKRLYIARVIEEIRCQVTGQRTLLA